MSTLATAVLAALLAQYTVLVIGVPAFTVDLSKKPEDRWTEVATYYKNEMIAMGQQLIPIMKNQLGDTFDSWKKDAWLDEYDEYEQELQGIVKTVNHPEVSMEFLKLMQMLYEVGSPTACSGVLWATENGTVIHGRNMDYGFHFQMTGPDGSVRVLNWPDITFEVTFKRGSQPLMKFTGWPGGVGVHTGMVFGGWSFEQNTRHNDWHDNLKAAKKGGKIFSLAVRHIMETVPDFKEAVDKIYATSFAAPQYFIMSGARPFEGAVLTIDRLGKHEADTPRLQYVTNSSKRSWHVVQTNDDLFTKTKDPRRPVANLMLQNMDRSDISRDNLLQFMHTPALFWHATVFTTVMEPATGYYKTVLPNEPPFPPKGSVKNAQKMIAGGSGPLHNYVKGGSLISKDASPPQPKSHAHRQGRFLAQRQLATDDELSSFMQLAHAALTSGSRAERLET